MSQASAVKMKVPVRHRELGKPVSFRATREQLTGMDEITRVEQSDDPRIKKSDVYRSAFENFIQLWREDADSARAAIVRAHAQQ